MIIKRTTVFLPRLPVYVRHRLSLITASYYATRSESPNSHPYLTLSNSHYGDAETAAARRLVQ